MIFQPSPLQGAYVILPEFRRDARGAFSRAFCVQEFDAHGLETRFVQANISTNTCAGTVRGMHFQNEPHAEVKLVRCIRGAVYDVIIDIRKNLPTFGSYFGAELTECNGAMMYVPKGFAHGYQALTDDAAVHYLVSAFYAPDHEGGIYHADPEVGIDWPLPIGPVSERDAKLQSISDSNCAFTCSDSGENESDSHNQGHL